MVFLPKKYIMRTGIGYASHKLGAFDRALICAGICDYNLIKVSSILPPNCEMQNAISLVKGALLPSAFASIYSNTLGERISAAVAVGIPVNKSDVGVIMEHSSLNCKEETEKQVRNFVEIAMKDRNILVEKVVSCSIQTKVETKDFYCAFATLSMWQLRSLIIAFVSAVKLLGCIDGFYIDITGLVVSQNFQDKGVGRSLLKFIESYGGINKIENFSVISRLHRKDAHTFYKKNGYELGGYVFYKGLVIVEKDLQIIKKLDNMIFEKKHKCFYKMGKGAEKIE